jgi:hypothetical protein
MTMGTQPAREPGKRRARARKDETPYVNAAQHVRNIGILESLTELQAYVRKHGLLQVHGDRRWSEEEAKRLEAALDEKGEELREAKGNEHAPPAAAEGLTGARLFVNVAGLLRNARNLTELNEVIEGHRLNDLIDGGSDDRFSLGEASKLKFMVKATADRFTPALETPPATKQTKRGESMSTGAAKKRATQVDLPTMEDRKNRELHDLAERWAQIKLGLRELKVEQDDLARKMAQILHRQKKMVYRCDGLVITLEEVEKVKVTTGKSQDEDDD